MITRTHVLWNGHVQTDLDIHEAVVENSTVDVESAFHCFQMTAMT